MELWIRSQDKENLSKTEHVGVYANRVYINGYEENGYCIGEYKTKERALEVLDEIEEIINNGIQETKYDSVGNKNYKIKTDRKVYKMPKE